MATTPSLLPIDAYLRTSYEPDADYVDGEIRIPRVEERLADYVAMGIENIWLIDPIRRSAHTYDAQGLHHADSTNLRVPHALIHLDMTEIFAALD